MPRHRCPGGVFRLRPAAAQRGRVHSPCRDGGALNRPEAIAASAPLPPPITAPSFAAREVTARSFQAASPRRATSVPIAR